MKLRKIICLPLISISIVACNPQSSEIPSAANTSDNDGIVDIQIERDKLIHFKELSRETIASLITSINSIFEHGETIELLGNFLDDNKENKNDSNNNDSNEFDPAEFRQKYSQAIDYFFSNPVKIGGETAYTPDPRICTEVIAGNDPGSCVEGMGHIRAIHTPIDETHGTIILKYDSFTPVIISYDNNSIKLNSSLSEVENMLIEINDLILAHEEKGMDVIPNMNGDVQLQLKLINNKTVEIEGGFLSDISFSGDFGNEEKDPVAIFIGRIENLFNATINEDSRIVNLAFDSNSLIGNFEINDDNRNKHLAQITFNGIHGNITLDDLARTINFQNIGIDGENAILKVDGAVTATLTANDLSFLLDLTNIDPIINLNSNIHGTLVIDDKANVLDDIQGTLEINIENGTSLRFDKTHDLVEILSGTFESIGSDDIQGYLLLGSGQCLTNSDDSIQHLFIQTSCQ